MIASVSTRDNLLSVKAHGLDYFAAQSQTGIHFHFHPDETKVNVNPCHSRFAVVDILTFPADRCLPFPETFPSSNSLEH